MENLFTDEAVLVIVRPESYRLAAFTIGTATLMQDDHFIF